eukprot:151014_1
MIVQKVKFLLTQMNVKSVNILYMYKMAQILNIMWNLGRMAYFCVVGQDLNEKTELGNDSQLIDIYRSICKGKLQQYMTMNHLLKYITPTMMSLLNGLLNTNEQKQSKSYNILKHKWFRSM